MAKVRLIEYTGKGSDDPISHQRGHYSDEYVGLNLLLFTKNTRLNMTPDNYNNFLDSLTPEQIKKGIEEMAQTIPSSWEFVDVTFIIEGVSRACAQQITRTRTGSYAMQSQRVVQFDDEFDYSIGPSIINNERAINKYNQAMRDIGETYSELITYGAKAQDARGVLPMNIHCNLVCKYDLRSFVYLIMARRSLRTQDEYADIIDQMYNQVIEVWPWAAPFFVPKHEAAIKLLEEAVESIGIETGRGIGWKIAKAIDLLRSDK